ncbi:MAG TPA: hypothetical protein VLA00_04970 [Xanthobacteraceae bacterium]|nr:hypothetical protein [Xanthobacteraceae bacterium]
MTRTSAVPAPWPAAPSEPSLDELLHDPLLHLILRRDRLTLGALTALLARERRRLDRPFASMLPKAA